jgi:hypothetical protein
MKKRHIILIISGIAALTLLTTFIIKGKSNTQRAQPESQRNSDLSTSLQSQYSSQNSSQHTSEMCDGNGIPTKLKELTSHRVTQGKYLEIQVKANHLSRDAAAYIFQASGVTYLQYLRYSTKGKNDINDLLAVDNKPHVLASDLSLSLDQAISNSSLSELGEKIKQLGIQNSTIIGGKSIITKLLAENKLSNDTDVHQFIASSKLAPNFSDLVQAIRSHINSQTIIALASYYRGDLAKTWREALVTNNLATYSARYGRPDLIEFWLAQGLTPSISSDNGKIINTILDMAASYRVPENASLALLKIAERYNVKPAGFHSYTFFNHLDIQNGHHYQRYLNDIKIEFMVNLNFITLPGSINEIMVNIEQLNQQIASLEQQATLCGLTKADNSKTNLSSVHDYSEQEDSDIPKDDKVDITSSEQYKFLVEEQALLKAKKYNEFLLAVNNNKTKFGDFVVNQSILLCINENAPFEVFKALFDMGGQLSPGAYALLAAKNNIEILKSFDEHNIKVTPTEHDIKLIRKYNLDKTIQPETRKLLQQLGFTNDN